MVTWSGLTPFSGQLEAWLRSKPAAGPPLSVVNTIIESWWSTFAFFLNEVTVVVMMILINSYMLSQIILLPGACGCAGALQRLCQHSRRACKASRRTYAGSSPARKNMYILASDRVRYCFVKWTDASAYPHWYQFLVFYLDVAVSFDCIFRGLYNLQCANVDITASVPSLPFNFSHRKCKKKLNNFH